MERLVMGAVTSHHPPTVKAQVVTHILSQLVSAGGQEAVLRRIGTTLFDRICLEPEDSPDLRAAFRVAWGAFTAATPVVASEFAQEGCVAVVAGGVVGVTHPLPQEAGVRLAVLCDAIRARIAHRGLGAVEDPDTVRAVTSAVVSALVSADTDPLVASSAAYLLRQFPVALGGAGWDVKTVAANCATWLGKLPVLNPATFPDRVPPDHQALVWLLARMTGAEDGAGGRPDVDVEMAAVGSMLLALCDDKVSSVSVGLSLVFSAVSDAAVLQSSKFLTTSGMAIADAGLTLCLSRMLAWPATTRLGPRLMAVVTAMSSSNRFTPLGKAVASVAPALVHQASSLTSRPFAWKLLQTLLVSCPGVVAGQGFPVVAWDVVAPTLVDAVDALVAQFAATPPSPVAQAALTTAQSALVALLETVPAVAAHTGLQASARTLLALHPPPPPPPPSSSSSSSSAYLPPPRCLSDSFQCVRGSVWAAGRSDELGGFLAPRLKLGVGLSNLGNTCYMNSVLQALVATTDLMKLVLGPAPLVPPTSEESKRSGPDVVTVAPSDSATAAASTSKPAAAPTPPSPLRRMFQELRKTFACMAFGLRPFQNPNAFHRLCPEPFNSYGQQDATEFARMTLDCIVSSTPAGPARTALEQVFGGTGATVVRCHTCGTISRRTEVFTDLSLALTQATVAAAGDDDIPLAVLMESLFQPEELKGDSAYRCSACGDLQPATKALAVVSPPQHLIVTLNRFWFDTATMKQRKITKQVVYPRFLELPVVDEDRLDGPAVLKGAVFKRARTGDEGDASAPPAVSSVEYELYAVVVHNGSSAERGHYFAFCRDADTLGAHPEDAGAWRRCNDSFVSSMTLEEVLAASQTQSLDTAYMMLYRRRDGGGGGGGGEAATVAPVDGSAAAAGAGAGADVGRPKDGPKGNPDTADDAGGVVTLIEVDTRLLQHVHTDNAGFLKSLEKGGVVAPKPIAPAVVARTGGAGPGAGGGGFGRYSRPGGGGFGGGFGGGGPAVF